MDTDNGQTAENVSQSTSIPNQDGGRVSSVPLVFLQESAIFGTTKPSYKDYLRHDELYKAIGNVINPTHITGLQRVNGMWRVYIDNLEDKATLMANGIFIRNKQISFLQTNPLRLDYENTVRIRIQNIPLSADDGTITRSLILRGIEVISSYREKLRIDNKLTNCETGDRIIIVRASSMKEPLPRFVQFGQFKAKVIHKGQVNTALKCTKCLDQGHTIHNCTNDWKCSQCMNFGHKKGECNINDAPTPDAISDNSDSSDDESTLEEDESTSNTNDGTGDQTTKDVPKPPEKPEPRIKETPTSKQKKNKNKNNKPKDVKGQPQIQKFMCTHENSTETPNKQKQKRGPNLERSPPTPPEQLHEESKKQRNEENK